MPVVTSYASPKRIASKVSMPVRVSLAAWYRYHVAVTNTAGNCTRWEDQSGNGRHLLQATASLGPTVRSDSALLFNGTNQYMQATFTLAQPYTVYIGLSQVVSTSGAIIFDGGNGGGNARLSQSTANAVQISAGTSLGADTTMPIGIATPGVACCVFNGASSVLQTAGGAASVTTSGNAGATAAGGITLGASRVPGNYANILVNEIAIFSIAHDAPTRLAMLRYMAQIVSLGGV
jgi:hypothetical protein